LREGGGVDGGRVFGERLRGNEWTGESASWMNGHGQLSRTEWECTQLELTRTRGTERGEVDALPSSPASSLFPFPICIQLELEQRLITLHSSFSLFFRFFFRFSSPSSPFFLCNMFSRIFGAREEPRVKELHGKLFPTSLPIFISQLDLADSPSPPQSFPSRCAPTP
jgi:hypothetical protein